MSMLKHCISAREKRSSTLAAIQVLHLRSRLNNIELSVLVASFDVLREASHHLLHLHSNPGNARHQGGPECLFVDDLLIRVVNVNLVILFDRDGIVEPGSCKPFQILRVTVGAENVLAALERKRLGRERLDLRLQLLTLLHGKAHGLPRSVAHQRLAETHNNLGVDFIAVSRDRVVGMNHKRVVSIDHLLAEDRHVDLLHGETQLSAREMSAFVPQTRPHALHRLPGAVKRPVNVLAAQLIQHTAERLRQTVRQAQIHDAFPELRAEADIAAFRPICRGAEFLEFLLQLRIRLVVQNFLQGAVRNRHRRGNVDPIGDLQSEKPLQIQRLASDELRRVRCRANGPGGDQLLLRDD
mmetsp:Transcript_17396/g.44366  ORF Transcript_17396/g.44366 Transcript_17396/m.44366 type:complete len:354 (+) Transcript_17396:1112-2173(+)